MNHRITNGKVGSTPEAVHVFVYGTLRRGGGRDVLAQLHGAEFIATGTVRGRLFDLGAYPGAVVEKGEGHITGEIYRIPAEALCELDLVEGCRPDDPATSYYHRRTATVRCDTGEEFTCWIYECNPAVFSLSTPIDSGNWIDYERQRSEVHHDRRPGE